MIIEIHPRPIDHDDSRALIAMLVTELRQEYADEHMHGVDFEEFKSSGGTFVVAYLDERPVGCGGLRPLDRELVELKRMFVVASHRGQGISKQVLGCLETLAGEQGFKQLVLETGDRQDVAIRLYEGMGYQRIAPFGEYQQCVRSICFGKTL